MFHAASDLDLSYVASSLVFLPKVFAYETRSGQGCGHMHAKVEVLVMFRASVK